MLPPEEARWLAKNSDGRWFYYIYEPMLTERRWYPSKGGQAWGPHYFKFQK